MTTPLRRTEIGTTTVLAAHREESFLLLERYARQLRRELEDVERQLAELRAGAPAGELVRT